MKELEIFLDRDCGDVLHGLNMAGCDALMPVKVRGSYRTIFLDHLAADGAGLTGLGNIQLVVVIVAHNSFSPFHFSGKQDAFRIGERLFFP